MANNNFNNNSGNKNSLRDRISQMQNDKMSTNKLSVSVKNSQTMENYSFEKNKEKPLDEDAIEKYAVERIEAFMGIYKNSLVLDKPHHTAEELQVLATRMFGVINDFKANHNKEDVTGGVLKSMISNLRNQATRATPDVNALKLALNEINLQARKELPGELQKHGFDTTLDEYFAADNDYYRIMRLDFESTLSPIDDRDLSEDYLKARDCRSETQYSPSDYKGLHKRSETWARCSDFPNFLNMQPQLFEALAEFSIPPETADKMRIRDIEDLMLMHKQKQNHNSKGNMNTRYALFGQDDAKRQFVKFVVSTKEKAAQFKDLMVAQGASPEYTDAMIERMRRNGVMNPGTVYNKKGEVIPPPDFKLSIHHKHAIHDLGTMKNKSDINNFDNFVLVLDKPYHQPICHAMDLPTFRKDHHGKKFIERLKFPKGLMVMFGFNPKRQMRLKENEQLPKRQYSWQQDKQFDSQRNNYNNNQSRRPY